MTVIHELSAPIWVQCKDHGEGRALLNFDNGFDHNPMFLVHLNDGRFRMFDLKEIAGCENLTVGITRPPPPQ